MARIDAVSSLSDKFWLNGGKEFLWSSEKDGWRHLYRISRDGKTETLLTKGNYDIMGVTAVDEAGGYVYFNATPDNATQRYLYRTKLDGSSAAERVSPMNQQGTHTYNMSPVPNLHSILSPIITRHLHGNGSVYQNIKHLMGIM